MKKLIYSYRNNFVKIFQREKDKISMHIKNVEIHHMGSTSVPGLGGKGMVDIMIGIKNWEELGSVIEKLKVIGFKHIHPKEKGRVFLSRIGPTSLGDVHIHIVLKDRKPYKDFLIFRNYLRKYKKEANKFFDLKQKWAAKTKEDRKEYSKLKKEYVQEVLKKCRKGSNLL